MNKTHLDLLKVYTEVFIGEMIQQLVFILKHSERKKYLWVKDIISWGYYKILQKKVELGKKMKTIGKMLILIETMKGTWGLLYYSIVIFFIVKVR